MRKLSTYKKFNAKYGISLDKKERTKLLDPENFEESYPLELLMARKLHDQREQDAILRLQRWWRRAKAFKIIRLLRQIRMQAASKIQRLYRRYVLTKLLPKRAAFKKHQACSLLQRRI